MLWTTYCGCTHNSVMGAKRPRFCSHGNLFVRQKAKSGRPGSSLSQGKGFAASQAQRDKVEGLACIGCGREESDTLAIDPAHVWPRGKGGCDHPDCVIPLCRFVFDGSGCHRSFDNGELDLLPKLADSEAWQVEQAHPILCHGVSVVELVRRLSGNQRELVWVERESVGAVAA